MKRITIETVLILLALIIGFFIGKYVTNKEVIIKPDNRVVNLQKKIDSLKGKKDSIITVIKVKDSVITKIKKQYEIRYKNVSTLSPDSTLLFWADYTETKIPTIH